MLGKHLFNVFFLWGLSLDRSQSLLYFVPQEKNMCVYVNITVKLARLVFLFILNTWRINPKRWISCNRYILALPLQSDVFSMYLYKYFNVYLQPYFNQYLFPGATGAGARSFLPIFGAFQVSSSRDGCLWRDLFNFSNHKSALLPTVGKS